MGLSAPILSGVCFWVWRVEMLAPFVRTDGAELPGLTNGGQAQGTPLHTQFICSWMTSAGGPLSLSLGPGYISRVGLCFTVLGLS
ncbi:hypothetical protein HD806DRAFT_480998 [Xylariaceae sp. AK1471]|nr:hypothetical protein HD806DRAFT_480998 [Xylariaceae sp. AK1471]